VASTNVVLIDPELQLGLECFDFNKIAHDSFKGLTDFSHVVSQSKVFFAFTFALGLSLFWLQLLLLDVSSHSGLVIPGNFLDEL
jgi:hypothetical protein